MGSSGGGGGHMGSSDSILREFNIDNCRVCIDIKDWSRRAQKLALSTEASSPGVATVAATVATAATVPSLASDADAADRQQNECPPDSLALGRATWTFLHTMAAYYPDAPTPAEQRKMTSFIELFSQFYPCGYCAAHLQGELVVQPPRTESRSALAQWFCRIHNEVNERLGKPLFDCSKLDERWRDGPSDGSCG